MNDYNKDIEQIYKELNTSINGISEEEANKRLIANGENKLKEKKKTPTYIMFFRQFNDLMIIILIIAAIFSAIVSFIEHESFADSIIIIIIVIINAILSFIQEKKADVAIEELNKMFITNTYVYRDGKKNLIDVKNVVVGDILELEAGDYVCADARIISCDSLEISEATLTGESKSIKKNNNVLDGEKALFERSNMVFAGCNVTNGHAFVVVLATGMKTELGKIATSLLDKKSDITPLQKKVNQISKILTYIILAIIITMMGIGLILKYDFFDILMLSISLAVAAIPEGMSSIITIILSLGMSSMAKKNVIIRKLASVETLGSTNIICSDKTGTITQNKMVVKSLFANNKLYGEKSDFDNLEELINCASACHNVSKNEDKYFGDETEKAIYKYLEDQNILNNSLSRIKEYPFDSDRKMMSVIVLNNQKEVSYTKGSLDSVLTNSKYYLLNNEVKPIDEEFINQIREIEKIQSAKSLRLLAFSKKDNNIDRPEEDMIFIGLIGMMDPPRESVEKAIGICKHSGIKPIMITGDSINTAIAIAKDVGIIDNGDLAIEGALIDNMNNNELVEAVNKYQVYARISPSTKLRIVEALQSQGLVVAMTGDGVNDAPAIQKADIGIGMGITGTEVVKNVADCILVDDSFSTIVDGVEEGRRITSNIKKVIMYLLVGNIIEVILVFVSMILNMEMFSTLQLLWINLVTDSIPAIMLAFEKAGKDLMDDSPANINSGSFFTPFMSARIIFSSIIKSIILIVLYIYLIKTADINVAGSCLFIGLIVHELLFAFSCRDLKHNVINKGFFSNKKLSVGVLLIAIIQIIVLNTQFSKYLIVQNIGLINVAITLSVCIIVFIVSELLKPAYQKLFKDYVGGSHEK